VPRYLLQGAYTSQAWAAQLRDPQNRVGAVGSMLEKLDGRFESAYFAFGEYDLLGIIELPDNVAAAAVSMLISAGGSVKAIKTTPLMSMDEGIEAMRRGAAAMPDYQAPGG
jgi:uncharacterized protein with GYD domain